MPLSPEATLQHSGGPPSRKRYTQREFLQLSVGEEAAENDVSDQVRESQRGVSGGRYLSLALSIPTSHVR